MKSMMALGAVALLAVTGLVREGQASIDCDSGGTVVINYEVSGDVTVDLAVANEPGTNLTLEDGANVSHDVSAYNDGTIVMTGGVVDNRVNGYGNSQVLISGGTVLHDVIAFDRSHLTFTGTAQTGFAMADDYGTLNITSGTVSGFIEAYGNSSIYLCGGSGMRELIAVENGMITVAGSNFRMGGVSVTGPLDIPYLLSVGAMIDMSVSPYGEYYGRMTGTLADGNPLDVLVEVLHRPNGDQYMGAANVILVPEPTTFLIFTAGAVILRRKAR